MEFIGQSLELWCAPLAAALRDRDPAPLLARARRQITAGATALDLNVGVHGAAGDLRWAAGVVREIAPGLPLLLDGGDEAALAAALEACHRDGVAGPLVANAAAVGAPDGRDGSGGAALFAAAARAGAGVVLSPRGLDGAETGTSGDASAAAGRVVETLLAARERARAGGVGGPLYLDVLAYPPAVDAARCIRSLDVLRALRDLAPRELGDAIPLVAAGNVGHGARPGLRAALRLLYAVAATGAGARAIMLPVEQRGLIEALALAAGERPPAGERARWLLAVATAAREGARWPEPPPVASAAGDAEREAWALLKP